ncbi:hypothetical protein RI129_010395 [Pyrocoelia pectoralis]|uniref:Cytochrome b5-related protein n=1 Tax=Pyrocoelia pectoralis TaxID=417401 RepID=A0AAN7V7W6_9COLE
MAANSNKPKVSLNFKYPSNRETIKSGKEWLSGKREDDDAEGLWRIHDDLYDVSDFIEKHPGGSSWLQLTKGTDITEAFEVHHLSSVPRQTLNQFFIRRAKHQRNSPFTFEDDGFYRTLKRNIIPVLEKIPKNTYKVSDIITDSLCVATFLFAIFTCIFCSFACGFISGLLLTFAVIASHNYLHRKDNLRMYLFNLSLLDFREMRISHALSHHLYTNTIYDLEMSAYEPLLQYLPVHKSLIYKWTSWMCVFVVWFSLWFLAFISRLRTIISTKQAYFSDLLPFTLPLAMYLFSGVSLAKVLEMWIFVIAISSFCTSAIGFTAGHHHPDVFHEGDAPRSKSVDWGIHQLDTVGDRREITGNTFLILTTFGDHVLHHLFPTLDHTVLQYLYPTFQKTMEEFNVKMHMKSQIDSVIGQFRQLNKDKPNDTPPGSSLDFRNLPNG